MNIIFFWNHHLEVLSDKSEVWMDLAAFSTTSSNSIGVHLKSELQKIFLSESRLPNTVEACMSKVLEISIHYDPARLEFFETDAGQSVPPLVETTTSFQGLKHPNSNKTARWRPSERSGQQKLPWWVISWIPVGWFFPHILKNPFKG